MDMEGALIWPCSLSPTSFEQQDNVHRFFSEVSGRLLVATCVIEDKESLLQKLYADEAVHHRITMAAFCSNSYSRVAAKSISRMSDWQNFVQNSYELRTTRPKIVHVEFNDKDITDTKNKDDRSYKPPKIKDHRKLNIRSVIDIHTWDQASWRGTVYAQFSLTQPPCVAFIFENGEAARKIFERWLARFGKQDENEEIYLSIIRYLPQQKIHYYCIQISSRLSNTDKRNPDQMIVMATRSMTMTPDSGKNLERFLESYNQFGAFYLMPAVLSIKGEPELLFDLAILKHNLTVKLAANVGKHDIEAIALRRETDAS